MGTPVIWGPPVPISLEKWAPQGPRFPSGKGAPSDIWGTLPIGAHAGLAQAFLAASYCFMKGAGSACMPGFVHVTVVS